MSKVKFFTQKEFFSKQFWFTKIKDNTLNAILIIVIKILFIHLFEVIYVLLLSMWLYEYTNFLFIIFGTFYEDINIVVVV